MTYAPVEEPRLHQVVTLLYSGAWQASVQRVPQFISSNEASQAVEQLMASSGWRERVTAAKIATAFGLHQFVEPLVHTFTASPETYTARAFALLLATSDLPNQQALLTEMERACPDSPYGRHLVEEIKNAFSVGRAA